MGFTLLSPVARAKTSEFKVSCIGTGGRNGGDKNWRIQISIPSTEFHKHFGQAERFDIALGDGADAGILLIRATENGAFRPTALKYCFIFRLPPSETTPQMEFKGPNPERRMTTSGLKVTLPSWAWEPGRWESIRDARDIARRQDAAAEKLTRKDTLQRIGQIKG
ncbi:hypothetical protein [Ciceribacter thiooxidans]|uniref:Uncharacterized protein n=1 Tax=Ciceribacter thiooxidans TaxID=1969821 RepID=A0ABV7I0Z0_9HYPH|nr:hypothetical protein [Ciceribacter thiooxidans]